ncbi:hypothetical protein [Arthrobacter sp. NicSoilB4]|uniref:hypothetical protein n=1 Tax=Arthrobacter sp. NicSoilB4 TaxID=2830997 RepID=UPI001CC7F5AE|nr:hypothetical protein [Arthrobacter sp. NicSoilB4]
MPQITITQVKTVNQRGENATLFNSVFDALSLEIHVRASADILALPNAAFTAEFQIFSPQNHQVVRNTYRSSAFNWGTNFWISVGNNWSPGPEITNPRDWGINHLFGDIFGFRGTITAQYIPRPGDGWSSLDAFDISPMRWFRVHHLIGI